MSTPKQSLTLSLPLRYATDQKAFEEASSSSQSSAHSSLSSMSEEGDEEPSVRSPLASVPPPVPARRAKFLNSHINSYNGNSDLSRSGHITFVSDSSPPPPPRYGPSLSLKDLEKSALSTMKPTLPPPLPARPSFTLTQEPVSAPPTPNRTDDVYASSPVIQERKSLGAGKLPPPPTRAIGLGDKLPPPRCPSASSDNESGEEDEQPREPTTLPDSSTTSRRVPVLRFRDVVSEPIIHFHPHSGCIAVSGSYVIVGHNHHIKVYDLSQSDASILNLDTRDMGLKEAKVTCMEFRPTLSKTDRGFLLWIGTKDGHLFEVDVRTGTIRGTKYVAHLHPVTHIFRHGRSMVTLDESGKALVFSPDVYNGDDVVLQTSLPRTIRTAEKQDFVKLIGGKLWTAARMKQHGSVSMQRLPIIRVYDIFNVASTGKSLLPIEHVGPVTSATILSSQPEMVYVGHEGGYISIWDLNADDGYPQCIEVMKVSVSDILCLEGVNERLWVGGRNGMISVYVVSQRPWIMTNCWNAHPALPVMKLIMNYYAIEKTGQLCVVSVGRDELVRLWDGLLGSDWIGSYLWSSVLK